MNAFPNPSSLMTQSALFETAQQIGTKLSEGAAQVFELNMQTVQAAFANATEFWAPPGDLETLRTGAAAAAGRTSQSATDYARRLYDIVAHTNLEVLALLQKRAILQAPEATAEMVSAATRNAPTGSSLIFPGT